MMFEEINEPINVVAIFQNGGITPLAFSWRRRRYEGLQTVARWEEYEGETRCLFFSLQDGPNLYQCCFHTRDLRWRLVKVYHG